MELGLKGTLAPALEEETMEVSWVDPVIQLLRLPLSVGALSSLG